MCLYLENIFGTRRAEDSEDPREIDMVQATAYLETGAGREMRNINMERKLVSNIGHFGPYSRPSSQDSDFDHFTPDYFKDFI